MGKTTFSDRQAKILVVESNESIRIAISRALSEAGFKKPTVIAKPRQVISYLDSGETLPDWIVMSLFPEEKINAIHLLYVFLKNKHFHNCRVSLFLEKQEFCHIRSAFEMGLLSWHRKDTSPEYFKAEFAQFLKNMLANDWDECLTSADYLRKHLIEEKSFNELDELDRNLLLKYPGMPRMLLRHAETQLLLGKASQAILAINHAKSLSEDVAEEAEAIVKKYLSQGDQNTSLDSMSFAEKNDLSLVVVIDSDQSVQKYLSEVLGELGCSYIKCFGNGEEAWQFLKSGVSPKLILQEWKIPKLSGAAFMQRLRTEGFNTVPVIVYSAVVGPRDRSLLREMGVSDIVSKPTGKKLLINTIKAIVEQETVTTDIQHIERKIRQELSARNIPAAKRLLEELLNHKEASDGSKLLMTAEFLFFEGNLKEARKVATKALHIAGESLPILNLLGKILLKMREYTLAKKFLQKAKEISPDNIDRLCSLAEVHTEMGQIEESEDEIKQAKKVDVENKKVSETEAKVAIAKGDTKTAKSIIEKMESSKDLVASLNNEAVYLATQGRFKESMKLYEKALKSLPEKQKEMIAIINYNMGLGYARQGDKPRADQYLVQAATCEKSPVFKKAVSLKQRVEVAVKKGIDIKLSMVQEDTEDSLKDEFYSVNQGPLPIASDIKSGDMCCHLLYRNPNGTSEGFLKLFESRPKTVEWAATELAPK